MAKCTGQITIIDYNDAITLIGYIGTNLSKTQQYNPDNGAFAPDWTTTNMVLTPSLFKAGSPADIIGSAAVTAVRWYEKTGDTPTLITNGADYTVGTTGARPLTIKTNKLGALPSRDYICEIDYYDPVTGSYIVSKLDITFNRVVNGGGIADAVCWAPDGTVFKNSSVSTLRAKIDLWRGSVIDTTNVTFEWFQMDSSVTVSQGGGVGWRKLSDVQNVVTGTSSNELTIYPDAVDSFAVFKGKVTDNDATSNTPNQSFYDTITVSDQSDPFQIQVVSTGGTVFKNGSGSSVLTARVFQAGEEVDVAGTKYTYTWEVRNNAGDQATFAGGETSKTGKSITVTDADVNAKSTFYVSMT